MPTSDRYLFSRLLTRCLLAASAGRAEVTGLKYEIRVRVKGGHLED